MSKKGQEEIIGFVVIVVVVMIVLFVFLSFILKSPERLDNEKEIKNFLDSIILYTTLCEQETGFLDLRELIIACNNNEQCLEGNSCEILENSVLDILNNTTKIGPDEIIKGQNVDIFYRFKDTKDTLISIKRGSCLNNISSAYENVYPADNGVVGIKLKECY